MKKIILKTSYKEVSATIQDETDLQEVLYTVSGLIKALGWTFVGELTIEEKP